MIACDGTKGGHKTMTPIAEVGTVKITTGEWLQIADLLDYAAFVETEAELHEIILAGLNDAQ